MSRFNRYAPLTDAPVANLGECSTCGAALQEALHKGVTYRRCPWTRSTSRPAADGSWACAWPRGQAKPDPLTPEEHVRLAELASDRAEGILGRVRAIRATAEEQVA